MKKNMFQLNMKRFVENKLYLFSMITYICLTIGYLIYIFNKNNAVGDELFQYVFPLWRTNVISLYSFAFFTFLAFEFSVNLYNKNLHEVFLCTPKKLNSICLNNIGVLTIWNAAYSVLLIIFNCFAFLSLHSYDKKYLIHIFLNIIVNIFLVNTFAVVFGQAVSLFKNRMASYIVIIMFLIISSKIGESISGAVVLSTDNRINPYYIYNFFDIFPPNLNWTPTYAMGFSILPYRIYLLLFWIFIMITIIIIFLNNKIVSAKSVFSVVLSVICVLLFVSPSSKIVMNSAPNNESMSDQYYYLSGNTENEKANYFIEKYEMKLKIDRKLNCNITMYPDKNLSEYSFTLYHGYTVKKVTDQNNNKLKFIQNGDYITVYCEDEIISITISYSGSGKGFYSNYQGIYLAGDFPYYPVAGKHPIYTESYNPIISENTPYFDISVISDLDAYSNLYEVKDNCFSGYTQAPCIFAGFLTAKEQNNVRIVYPYLYGESDHIDDIFEMIDLDKCAGKTVFIEPHVNVQFDGIIRSYEDAVLAPNYGDLLPDEYFEGEGI